MYSNCVLRETRKGNTEMLLVQGQGRAGWDAGAMLLCTFFPFSVYFVCLCGDNLLIRSGWLSCCVDMDKWGWKHQHHQKNFRFFAVCGGSHILITREHASQYSAMLIEYSNLSNYLFFECKWVIVCTFEYQLGGYWRKIELATLLLFGVCLLIIIFSDTQRHHADREINRECVWWPLWEAVYLVSLW